jgi:hypothetical protein
LCTVLRDLCLAGFLERERERERERKPTHLLIQEPPLPTSLLAHREVPKANTKQEQPKGYGRAQSTGKEPKTQEILSGLLYYNKVD